MKYNIISSAYSDLRKVLNTARKIATLGKNERARRVLAL
jgi:hypothetical protein